MIVRRITAGAAGLALVGTASRSRPGHGEEQHHHAEAGRWPCFGAHRCERRAVSGQAREAEGHEHQLPGEAKGKNVTHKGGLKLTAAAGFVIAGNISINFQERQGHGRVGNPVTPDPLIAEHPERQGGKNKIKKNGTWKNGKVTLVGKSVGALGSKQDPANPVHLTVLGLGGSYPDRCAQRQDQHQGEEVVRH